MSIPLTIPNSPVLWGGPFPKEPPFFWMTHPAPYAMSLWDSEAEKNRGTFSLVLALGAIASAVVVVAAVVIGVS